MTKNINYIEMEEACNYLWVTTKEIRIILGGCSKTKADTFRKKLEEKLKAEKIEALKITDEKERLKALARCFYYEDTHPHRLPIKRVLEEAHIDLDFVRREANKMRKALIIERKYERSEISEKIEQEKFNNTYDTPNEYVNSSI